MYFKYVNYYLMRESETIHVAEIERGNILYMHVTYLSIVLKLKWMFILIFKVSI
jgi:hypothetical protein